MELTIIALVFVLVVALVVLGQWAAAQRRKQMAEWAAANGLSFTPGKNKGLRHQFPEFQCLREGRNRYAENIIFGDWHDRPVQAFDYHYETYTHDSKGRRRTTHHRFSAVILESPLPLKPLFIRPETFLDKITEFIGLDDIDFESAEFSRQFYVKAADKRWAYDVIHARTMQRLLACPGYTIQFGHRAVIVWLSTRFDIPGFTRAIDLAHDLLDGMPEYLVREMEEQS